LTSKEKLAILMAQRALRKILREYRGSMDFFSMIQLFNSQPLDELSNGEFEEYSRMKTTLDRRDDSRLESDMKELDGFKETLGEQLDKIIEKLLVGELSG
jgi:hypothetical protein